MSIELRRSVLQQIIDGLWTLVFCVFCVPNDQLLVFLARSCEF